MKIDAVSDMITRIRNAYKVGKKNVSLPHTNYLEQVANVLVEEKYLNAVEVSGDAPKKTLNLSLSYVNDTPALSHIKRISKPGVRIYSKNTSLKPILSGMGIAVLSTSQGIMTDRTAKKKNIGGEVLFELW